MASFPHISPSLVEPVVNRDWLGRVKIYNAESSSSFSAGSIIAVTSSDSATEILNCKLALDGAGDLTESGWLLVAAGSIAAGSYGDAYMRFYVETGLDTSGSSVGDPVYLSAASGGARTTTKPSATARQVGWVSVSSATAGAYVIAPSLFTSQNPLTDLDINGQVDQNTALTAAGAAFDQDGTINHATAAYSGFDVTAVQLTTARSSGTVAAFKGATTSLATDSGGSYVTFLAAAPTDGGGSATHIAMQVGAGYDVLIDASSALTGEADVLLGDNLASAWQFREAANAYITIVTTNGSEAVQVHKLLNLDNALDLDHALTAAGDGANAVVTINHATAVAYGADVSITQLTTARSAGHVSSVVGRTTSLAGDSGGVYAAFEEAHTDGGGSGFHTFLYSEAASDALLTVSATGRGGVTVSADGMTANPETDQEAGYVAIKVGGTSYQIPIYAA